MRKILITTLIFTILLSVSVPTFANDYSFESGSEKSNVFGKSTSNDDPVTPNPQTTNVRRNKDVSSFPPSYGVFSGNIPTDPTSPYHSNNASGLSANGSGWSGGIASSNNGGSGVSTSIKDANLPDGMLPSTSVTTLSTSETMNTAPSKYNDGSIGSLYITKLKKTIKVYEGETLENMKKGIGHFEMTSAWDGNCGFAGHNRGASAYFGFVKDLSIGDRITYTTQYGVRTYEIYSKEKVSETDYSSLGWTAENIITLITCVENVPELRWCVQAREVK